MLEHSVSDQVSQSVAQLVLHYPRALAPCSTMSQQPSFDQRVTVYSNEASMANGSGIDGEFALLVVKP